MNLKLGGSIGAACVETSLLLFLLALVAVASVRVTGEKVAMNLKFAAEGGTDGTIVRPPLPPPQGSPFGEQQTNYDPAGMDGAPLLPISDPMMSGTGF